MKTRQNNGAYEGIVADTYDLWFAGDSFEDTAFYEECMREVPGLALEIGCGTGRLLLPYLKKGLPVHGVEPSAEMREICKEKGAGDGVAPVVYDQWMQELDLPDTYKTIFIPLASFMLVADWKEARKALELMYAHLEEGGQLIVPLFIPREHLTAPKKEWTVRRVAEQPHGTTIVLNQASDLAFNEQIQTNWNRYEIYRDGILTESSFASSKLRWYSRNEFWLMLEAAGLKDIEVYGGYDRSPLSNDGTFMIFRAWKRSSAQAE
ncbi:class I SAM-dependent methyltransferase [Paenibacillus sp. GCM10027627]|uniref:class I SAM-dependent methyltransferase n=1 Tax=unclassified Paenibacillus TaxID=185978 RepID=UPI003627F87A